MDQPDSAVAANVVTAVLASHFKDLGRSSPGWNLADDSLYLASLTRRALGPLLREQHRLVQAAEDALESGKMGELRVALARLKALAYVHGSAAGEIVRLDVELVGDQLVGAWSGDAPPDVRDAVREAAASLASDDHRYANANCSSVRFTARRYGGTVEVEVDVPIADKLAGRSLQDVRAVAVAACSVQS